MAGSEVNQATAGAATGTSWAPGPDGPALAEDPDRLQRSRGATSGCTSRAWAPTTSTTPSP